MFCKSCLKDKPASPKFFQRRGKGFRTPCKECMKKKPTTGYVVRPENVLGRLLEKFGRKFFIRVEKDGKTEIRAYGDHSEQFKAKSPNEAINLALQ